MATSFDDVMTTASLIETRAELCGAVDDVVPAWQCGDFTIAIKLGNSNLWALATGPDGRGVALRIARSRSGILKLGHVTTGKQIEIELATTLGTHRARIETARRDGASMLHCTASFLPLHDFKLEPGPRDLYPVGPSGNPLDIEGCVHAAQRGLRSGVVFASASDGSRLSFLYFQDFSALASYFNDTDSSPKDTVAGSWPEVGYAPPPGTKPLRGANEYTISDAYVFLTTDTPNTDGEAAGLYLDLFAQAYIAAKKPRGEYHHWPATARETVLHLSQSPACTYERHGRRYVTPYVGDDTKPPESMVQLVVLLALLEYQAWSGERVELATEIERNVQTFFDPKIGSLVRWLPGEPFTKRQDPTQSHDAMDSWYLYHILFNLGRLAQRGDARARDLLRQSLPYAIRVARRFSYRWPVFFHPKTLDIIRAEAAPGRGGENDVAGLYALVMLHAADIFDDPAYIDEAETAIGALDGLGFRLGYQINTTLFGAEAALRLFLKTGESRYLDLSHICLANAFNNMWLWECDYGNARTYPTFFGLFPLQDAPYLAAYEELEALAKFREYFRLGGDCIRPSVRLLLAEYCKHMLQRGHYYFPSSLPAHAVATKSANGKIERTVAVPLEDLRDGRELCGQVGQETYGAGLAPVCATRHYLAIDGLDLMLFCDYPAYGFKERGKPHREGTDGSRRRVRRFEFRLEGDERMACEVRLIPTGFGRLAEIELFDDDGAALAPHRSPEGHLVFMPRGNRWLDLVVSNYYTEPGLATKS